METAKKFNLETSDIGPAAVVAEEEKPAVNDGDHTNTGSDNTYVVVEETLQGMSKHYMLHPDGNLKNLFDLWIGALILFSVFWVPVEIGFNVNNLPEGLKVFQIIVTIFFFFDMCVSFRTVYFSKLDDAYVAVPYKVYMNYLQTWFIIDLVSFFPFSEIVASTGGSSAVKLVQILKLLRLLRLLKFYKFLKTIDYRRLIERGLGISSLVIELLETLFCVTFLAHLVACFWWGLSKLQTVAWFDGKQSI